jgi:hypothetical protein
MAKRILPYRDYSEHDVLNLFSLEVDESSDTLTEWVEAANGKWDSGVVVKVNPLKGELPGDVYNTESGLSEHNSGEKLRNYLGASPTSAHIGYNAYPYNGMTVEPAGIGDVAVGITLRETLAYDENGEKLLYYKQKLDEAQAVLPGQTVPVLTRGLVLLDSDAVTGDPAVGAQLEVGADGTLVADTSVGNALVATVLAKSGSDKFLCKISF